MPSVKPDQNEIRALLHKRGLPRRPEVDLFSDLKSKCWRAMDGGFITRDRAVALAKFLEAQPAVAGIFPNTILNDALRQAIDDWNSENESRLLELLGKLYVGDGEGVMGEESPPPYDCGMHEDLEALRLHEAAQLYARIFDTMPADMSLRDRFVAFTGSFEGVRRRTLFENARELGGVPCDPTPFLDYLFVADKDIQTRRVSRTLEEAIDHRRVGGSPLILRESDWNEVVRHTR